MATSGVIRPSSNGILATWSLAGQSVAGNYSVINVAVGWSFQSSPTDRQLDNGILQVNGNTVWQVNGRVKNYTGSTGAHDYYAWSGQVTIYHDGNGNASVGLYAHMTGYSGSYSEGSGGWALPQIPRFPSAPGSLAVSGHQDSDPTTATFTWTAPSDVGAGLQNAQLVINEDPTVTEPLVGNYDSAWRTSQAVTGLPKGTTLYAWVRASSSAGLGPWSNMLTFSTGYTAPSTPGAPVASGISGTMMTVTWTPPSDTGGAAIASYEVQRATNSSFSAGLVTTNVTNGTSLQVTGLTHTTTYYYRVRAFNSLGLTGGYSTVGSGTTGASEPGTPAAPTIASRTPTATTIAWTAPSDNGGSAITGYDLQWSASPNFDSPNQAAVGTTASPYTFANLAASTQYYARVRAKNAVGVSPWSTPTPARTTSGARVPNGSGNAWEEADVWVAVQGAQGFEWRRCKVVTIAG